MASKMAKYGHLEYLVEYPTLMLDGQNLNYSIRFEENVQKPSKTERFLNFAILGGFWKFSLKCMQYMKFWPSTTNFFW